MRKKHTLTAAFVFFSAAVFSFPLVASEDPLETESSPQNLSFSIVDGTQRGVLKQESVTKARLTAAFDQATGKDILEFDYSIPGDSPVTVWVKNFPSNLMETSIDTAKISVKPGSGELAKQISIAFEIKGPAQSQTIQLPVQRAGWTTIQQGIDWAAIGGAIHEVAFVMTPVDHQPSAGSISFALDFVKRPPPPEKKAIANNRHPEASFAEGSQSADPSLALRMTEAPKSFYSLLDAKERGVLKTDLAKASLMPTFDEVVGKDVFEFDFKIPKGGSVTLWAKEFPADLKQPVDAFRVGIRVWKSEILNQISLTVELIGSAATQTIPIDLKPGWNSLQETIDWDKISLLKEVRFNVSNKDDQETAKGTIAFSAEFTKKSSAKIKTVTEAFSSTFSVFDSGAKGVFNIGPGNGNITTVFDETIQKDVWAFTFQAPKGSHLGIWTKDYPAELGPSTADAVKIGATVLNAADLNQAVVKVEIKGSKDLQTIKLKLKPGRNSFREAINWNTVGDLTEAVFVVSPIGQGESSSGTFQFDLEFGKLSFLEKNYIFVKVALVLLIALIAALAITVPGTLLFPPPSRGRIKVGGDLLKDFFYGAVAVAIAGLTLAIYSLGFKSPLDIHYTFLWVGLGGALLAEIVSVKATGKHLSAAQTLQHILVTGLLAAASSRMEIFQVPATWGQLMMFSKTIAAVTFVIYQVSNTLSLIRSQKHLRPVTATLITAIPYLFGWLLLLENGTLLQTLANYLTGGLLSAWPAVREIIGRLIIVFGFNEAIINLISYATKERLVKAAQAHLFTLFVSLSVALSPEIADLGSTAFAGSLPIVLRALVSMLTTMLSYAGLWGEVYLITGIILDGMRLAAPSLETISKNILTGMKKGMWYSAILVALLYLISMALSSPLSQWMIAAFPLFIGILAGAALFPLLKTIIESFDGSIPFLERAVFSYKDPVLYLRGAVVGFGFAYMVQQNLFAWQMPPRILFGLVIGLIASGGVSVLRDAVYGMQGRGRIQSWRLYLIDSFLGMFVGSAGAFYLDSSQVPVVIEKFKLYTSAGFAQTDYITYPLVNKWGRIDLGTYSGGSKLLFTESLAGVINWSIAAWLFAINKVLLQSCFEKNTSAIKFFFSKAGFAELMSHMLYVLRWGLWMSPIIFTFLRMMPHATWYNQDGAIRTLFTVFNSAIMAPSAFQEWSLKVFIWVLAFDFFRVLIWMDHMGLRVATLVNLSFIGMDKLDEKIAKFIGPASAQRYIPEAVKRFMTWAPLLIPFYLPRGESWDYAWNTSEAIQNASQGGLITFLQSLPLLHLGLVIVAAILVSAGLSALFRAGVRRAEKRREKIYEMRNREYRVCVKESAEVYSEVIHKEWFDVTRRSYDFMDPSGRILFLLDSDQKQMPFWPVTGNFPKDLFEKSKIEKNSKSLAIVNAANGIRTTVEITLPDRDATCELWTVKIENLTAKARRLKAVPYLEWVLNGWHHDRFHTQYARLFPEMEYANDLNAILAWQKSTKSMGILASDRAPEGFLTSRMDFIGRAQSIWKPRIFETMNFSKAHQTAGHPTFDPIGSLLLDVDLKQKDSQVVRFLIGQTPNKKTALELIQKYLKPVAKKETESGHKEKSFLIGHGEILPGTNGAYSEFKDNGKKLVVNTPFTPRPYDHALSNEIHSVMVTNRGLHTSCNGNSQQNRLTPDWSDTVTKEIPAEAIYLFDPDQKEWYSPTFHPLNDQKAKHVSEFGVDGTAIFYMTKGAISSELTVFVPPYDPTGVYLLTVKNNSDQPKRLKAAPYFQMVLSFMSGAWPWEREGDLLVRCDQKLGALYFENPRNTFRSGWAFATTSLTTEHMETRRGKFFGSDRGVQHPYLVETGEPDQTQETDHRQIAGFLGTLEIPAHGESTFSVVMGQTENFKEAEHLVRKYKTVEQAQASLDETRKWWLRLMDTVKVESNHASFDQLQNWLKYQALAERIWARRGFYQTSGAFGFRDQLQDTVNMIWVDPALARKQILVQASHQFDEGDVFHWFFTLPDGRTAFSCRSHASDNPVWLPWAVTEYIRETGDETILDEMTSYVVSEFPFAKLPKNKHGWGHLYHRSTLSDTVYRHCLKSIDLVFNKRTGKHGLPLIQTGDWNDGLDEIGSAGRGESVWLGFFLYYIMKSMIDVIGKKDGAARREHYQKKMDALKEALESTWREDRYLRAIHDDGTEIGIKGSGIWEIDALTAAWAVMADINFDRGATIFDAALAVLEKENTILLGWPALREDVKPYLGRSSKYPEGVRENGMYCHGVQWLVGAARVLAEQFEKRGDTKKADHYRETAYRLWLKISAIAHVAPGEIEIYGGQPNKQAADILTNFDRGRMIWHGYTGAAGWMLRQAFGGVVGASLKNNQLIEPRDLGKPRGTLKISHLSRDVSKSPLRTSPTREMIAEPSAQKVPPNSYSIIF